MNSSMITCHTNEATVTVEINTKYVGRLGASSQLCDDVSISCVKYSDQSSLSTGCSNLANISLLFLDGEPCITYFGALYI